MSSSLASYQVNWIADVPGYTDDGDMSVHLYIVGPNGDKLLVRCTNISNHRKLRDTHNVPAVVNDLQVLTQNLEPLVRGMRAENKFDHFELAVGPMTKKQEGGQSVNFPATAFEDGTTNGKIN